jgi:hypothetical protein
MVVTGMAEIGIRPHVIEVVGQLGKRGVELREDGSVNVHDYGNRLQLG